MVVAYVCLIMYGKKKLLNHNYSTLIEFLIVFIPIGVTSIKLMSDNKGSR